MWVACLWHTQGPLFRGSFGGELVNNAKKRRSHADCLTAAASCCLTAVCPLADDGESTGREFSTSAKFFTQLQESVSV